MHHGSRRFPARCVTTVVSAESAGVCKAPSVICGLGFHGLDFKWCLARLTSASSHTQAPRKCWHGAPSPGSRSSPRPSFPKYVGEGGAGAESSAFPHLWWFPRLLRVAPIRCCHWWVMWWAHSAAPGAGGGGSESWRARSHAATRPRLRAGPAAPPFKTS